MFFVCQDLALSDSINTEINYKILTPDLFYMFWFSFFDILVTMMRGSSIKSINFVDWMRLIFTKNVNVKKLISIISLQIKIFLFMLLLNLAMLILMTNGIELLCLYFQVSIQTSLVISMICIIFQVHTQAQTQMLFILGLFNINKEKNELICRGDAINYSNFFHILDKAGEVAKKQNTSRLRYSVFLCIRRIRQWVYAIVFKNPDYYFETFYGNKQYLQSLSTPNNHTYFNGMLNNLLHIFMPHPFYLMLSYKGISSIAIRIFLYIIFIACKIFFMINLAMFLLNKNIN